MKRGRRLCCDECHMKAVSDWMQLWRGALSREGRRPHQAPFGGHAQGAWDTAVELRGIAGALRKLPGLNCSQFAGSLSGGQW